LSVMSIQSAPKLVLVVEDDPAIAKLVARTLEAEGYVVDMVHDGEAALVYCANKQPDVMVLDVNLPKLDGFGVAKRMKTSAEMRMIPIIFLTAKDRPQDMIAGIQAGAKHYLSKPFKAADLVSKVKKLASPS
jgi:two-component system, OmpR family, response regulator